MAARRDGRGELYSRIVSRMLGVGLCAMLSMALQNEFHTECGQKKAPAIIAERRRKSTKVSVRAQNMQNDSEISLKCQVNVNSSENLSILISD